MDEVRQAAPSKSELHLVAVLEGGALVEQRRAAAAYLRACGDLPRGAARRAAAVSELLTAYGVDAYGDLRAIMDRLT